ncbi:putative basic proline-rich protein-like isoform X1 [Iris pallida]|uniref:Basic proline-rich protein-like isoform X1 n=1 Tax=Iris pallida TaxID=29817 RepID=A0AAX6HLI5_IRIPA|nr:putative basic proline-rich protein-like isoform X1 [Iris pallida]
MARSRCSPEHGALDAKVARQVLSSTVHERSPAGLGTGVPAIGTRLDRGRWCQDSKIETLGGGGTNLRRDSTGEKSRERRSVAGSSNAMALKIWSSRIYGIGGGDEGTWTMVVARDDRPEINGRRKDKFIGVMGTRRSNFW